MSAEPPLTPSERYADRALRLVLAWALVGIPLAWGVWQVFQKSLALFR